MQCDDQGLLEASVPDYAEPILGWRTWFIAEATDGYRLRSVVYPSLWPPCQPLHAVCHCPPRRYATRPWRRRPGHDAVQVTCTCGIYAVDRLERAAVYADIQPRAGTLRQVVVAGVAALWGRLVVAEHGWRGSRAYPSHLYVARVGRRGSGPPSELAADLHRAYAVPVEPLEASTMGTVIESLRHLKLEAVRRIA